jgi:DNA-binding transcriptional ArsR family regulator
MTNHVTAFSALADPTRRAIFESVAKRPQAVGELASAFPISRPAVSQHLQVLKSAKLVICKTEGTRNIYRIDPRGIGEMRDWLDRHWDKALISFQKFVDAQEEDPS